MPSSVVAATRYDEKTFRLRVIFQSRSIYNYLKVPEKLYDEMKKHLRRESFLTEKLNQTTSLRGSGKFMNCESRVQFLIHHS